MCEIVHDKSRHIPKIYEREIKKRKNGLLVKERQTDRERRERERERVKK